MKLLLSAKKYLEKTKMKPMRPDSESNDVEEVVDENRSLQLKLVTGVVFHPIDYAKHLMQMGHEPLPAYPISWFGRQVYVYPNVFEYVRHIYSIEGVFVFFRGILFKSSATLLYHSVNAYYDKKYPPPKIGDSLINKIKRNVAVKSVCTLVSHPLQLLAVRCMAQFVGKESYYSEWNIVSNIFRILKFEGLSGLFKGFWAKLLGEIALVTTSIVLVHGIYTLVHNPDDDPQETSDEKSMVLYSTGVNLVCLSYFYPYTVLSSTMSVNGTGLRIGEPPLSPIFNSTLHCQNYLSSINQLKRGSQMIYRFVPTVPKLQ